jgi:hypothetical protein
MSKLVIASGVVLAIVTALHPPWTARATTSRMSFDGFPAVPPSTVFDSATWTIPFAPIYSPPSLDIPSRELASYLSRLRRGDSTAAVDWQRRMQSIEQRYRVPEKLRSRWIRDDPPGSAPGVAYTTSVVSARFSIDALRFSIQLLGIAALTAIVAVLAPKVAARANEPD